MKLRYFNLIPLLLLFVLCLPSPAFAQSESGSINGLITDPGGAVIPGATVTVTDLGTNAVVSTKTGAKGQYSFSTLRASRYKITVSAPGFKDTIVPDVELHTQDKLDQNASSTSALLPTLSLLPPTATIRSKPPPPLPPPSIGSSSRTCRSTAAASRRSSR